MCNPTLLDGAARAPILRALGCAFGCAFAVMITMPGPALAQAASGGEPQIELGSESATNLEAILERVTELLIDRLGLDDEAIEPETDLVGTIGVDRTALHYALEEIYLGFAVKPQIEDLTTPRSISSYIEEQVNFGLTLKADDVEENAYYTQRVHFATDRANTGVDDGMRKAFDGRRSDGGVMSYGYVDVNIPTAHKEGQIETPWRNVRFLENPRKHIFITNGKVQEASAYFAAMADSFDADEEDVLVYVHGFNVDWDDAIVRAAQVAVDLDFPGLPVAFTWPSDGKGLAYAADWADAIWSSRHLETFLADLNAQFPDRRIHVVAHSMGNRVLLHALRLAAASGTPIRIENAILAAPDFDADLFIQQVAGEVRDLAAHWTIYTSENDLPLNVARRVNAVARLGTPTPFVEGYEIIDASKIEVSPWNVPENHSYYAVKSRVIADISAVIAGTRPAGRRDLTEIRPGAVWGF